MNAKVNLLDFDYHQLENFFERIDEKKYRAHQLFQWMYQKGVHDFSQMTNIGKSLIEKLNRIAEVRLPKVISSKTSSDGTQKFVIQLDCGNAVETVFIPELKRGTLCVSSQVGCGLNCSFCATAAQGFNRNLTTGEIIGQLCLAKQQLALINSDLTHKHPLFSEITNVVMMGMGEPLLNFENATAAMSTMMHDLAFGLSKYRVTLSTSGVLPELIRLKEKSPVALAVSLHAPNDRLRNQLVPINKKYPLEQLMQICKTYFDREPRRVVTFEYVMLKNVNDTKAHAIELCNLLKDISCKVNLIPFNPFALTPYECSTDKTIEDFRRILTNKNINTIVRKTRGRDIDAACGQLAGEFQDKTSRSQRWQKVQFNRIENQGRA